LEKPCFDVCCSWKGVSVFFAQCLPGAGGKAGIAVSEAQSPLIWWSMTGFETRGEMLKLGELLRDMMARPESTRPFLTFPSSLIVV
jgi:hypothetical protein